MQSSVVIFAKGAAVGEGRRRRGGGVGVELKFGNEMKLLEALTDAELQLNF